MEYKGYELIRDRDHVIVRGYGEEWTEDTVSEAMASIDERLATKGRG